MKNKYKNSISNIKMKLNLIQEKVKEITDEVNTFCPKINFCHNNFQSNIIGQFKIFILGFSNLLTNSKKMKFSK